MKMLEFNFTMLERKLLWTLLYSLLIKGLVFTTFTPSYASGEAWAKNQDSFQSGLAKMNKTLQDHIYKKRFLDKLKTRMGQSSGGAASQHETPVKNSNGSMILGNKEEQIVPKSAVVNGGSKTLGNPLLPIRSESDKKNHLIFPLKNYTFDNRTLITKISLWIHFVYNERPKKKTDTDTTDSSSSSSSSSSILSTASSTPAVSKDNLYRKGSLSSERKRLRKLKKNRNKKNMVRIAVFSTDTNGKRKEKVLSLKAFIKRTGWKKLNLPVKLIPDSLSSSNNVTALKIIIKCKKCPRNPRLVLPKGAGEKRRDLAGGCSGTRRKRIGRRRRKLSGRKKRRRRVRKRSKKCTPKLPDDEEEEEPDQPNLYPFLIIEEMHRVNLPRSKRSASPTRDGTVELSSLLRNGLRTNCANHDTVPSDVRSNDSQPSSRIKTAQSCCHKETRYVDFSDMNLGDTIVYPSGFNFVTCKGSCYNGDESLLQGTESDVQRSIIHNVATLGEHLGLRHRNSTSKSSLQRLKSNPSLASNDSTKHRHKSDHTLLRQQQQQLPQQHLLSQSLQHNQELHHLKSNNHLPSRHQEPFISKLKKRTRLKTASCEAAERESLVIYHFNHEQTLVQTEIPDFVIKTCRCNSY